MRTITQESIRAFLAGEKFSKSNTTVSFCGYNWILSLHGNDIAHRNTVDGTLAIQNAGWFSNTTKERLNGIPGVSISQKKGVWYLNGTAWDGKWKVI